MPDIFSAIGRNRFLTLERKVTQLELILAKALHILNNGSNVKNACSKLLSSFVGQFTDSEVLVAVLIRLLSSTQENVSLSTRNNLHRFKSLDALADRLPKSISPANRRIVYVCLLCSVVAIQSSFIICFSPISVLQSSGTFFVWSWPMPRRQQ